MRTDSQEPGWMARLVQLGKVAGALASIVGIIFLLLPALKPEPVRTRAVTLSDLKVYIRKFDTSEWAIVHFTAQIEGYQGTSLPVQWALYSADTGLPHGVIIFGEYPRERGSPTAEFRPTAARQSLPGELRVQLPARGGNWKVGVEITDPSEHRVAYAETAPFRSAP